MPAAMWAAHGSGFGAAVLLVVTALPPCNARAHDGALEGAPSGSAEAAQAAPVPSATTDLTGGGACLALHESAQEHRLDGKLLRAREMLRSCADASCPSMVRADCATLLAEVQRVVPTLVFELENAELDPLRVRATVASEERRLEFSTPLEFDSGSLTVRFEAAGYQTLEETLIVREGEKNRLVPVRLSLPPPPPLPPFPPTLGDTRPLQQKTEGPDEPSHSRALGYLFGGVAVGAAVTSAYFAFSALDRRAGARQRCAPLCAEGESDAIADDLLAADIAAGVAVLSGGVSLTLLVVNPPSGDPVATTKTRGLTASIGGAFR